MENDKYLSGYALRARHVNFAMISAPGSLANLLKVERILFQYNVYGIDIPESQKEFCRGTADAILHSLGH